jgi:hypothetical protein
MDYLWMQYKNRLVDELKGYGFRIFRKTFFRVINDVVQQIILETRRGGCNVEFGILPLCFPVDKSSCMSGGRYNIGMFLEEMKAGWPYISEIDLILDEFIFIIKEYTIPFFEQANDSRKAYEEIVKFEKTVYGEKAKLGKIPGGIIMNDFVKVCLCIRSEDFANAGKHMQAIISQNEQAFAINMAKAKESNDPRRLQEYQVAFEVKIESKYEFLAKIALPDLDYFSRFVNENEAKSLQYLKRPK